ncbi:MAG: type II toxin-antitoxin system PemK/MazF family toxin [Syntrophus sp. (in: bacteria)]
MVNDVHRGDIWIVDWSPGRGSEQTGTRPAVVIQTDAANLNPLYPNTIVLTVSTKGKAVPFHVAIDPSEKNGLKEKSYIKCEQVLTISKKRLVRRMGGIEEECLSLVTKALRRVLVI